MYTPGTGFLYVGYSSAKVSETEPDSYKVSMLDSGSKRSSQRSGRLPPSALALSIRHELTPALSGALTAPGPLCESRLRSPLAGAALAWPGPMGSSAGSLGAGASSGLRPGLKGPTILVKDAFLALWSEPRLPLSPCPAQNARPVLSQLPSPGAPRKSHPTLSGHLRLGGLELTGEGWARKAWCALGPQYALVG